MKVTVTRNIFTDKSTIGMMDIDGVFQCYTLELPKRDSKPCCIPAGTYHVKMMPSARFQTILPHVLDVPGFTAIEIHTGNFPEDIKGCTAVGQGRSVDCVWNSRSALTALLLKLPMEFDIEYVDSIPK